MSEFRAAAVAAAFVAACRQEVFALKPGNVHIHAAGHGMTVDDFLNSAAAAAPPLTRPGSPLGRRIFRAVQATRAVAGQNTNLGIILLCAPLAMAAEAGGDLRGAVAQVLERASLADTADLFAAIALAAPGGLGQAPEHDVHGPATVPPLAAMAAAAQRDSIARQWRDRYEDIFVRALPWHRAAQARWNDSAWAATELFLHLLAAVPDSHVARKSGIAAAEAVQAEAAAMLAHVLAPNDRSDLQRSLLAWDADLKARRINPGTSADLTVATLFTAALMPTL